MFDALSSAQRLCNAASAVRRRSSSDRGCSKYSRMPLGSVKALRYLHTYKVYTVISRYICGLYAYIYREYILNHMDLYILKGERCLKDMLNGASFP